MINWNRLVGIPLAGVLLLANSGCVVLGRQQKENRLDAGSVESISKGMSAADVTRILGAPQEILFSNREHDPLREHAYVFEHETSHYTGISLALVNFGEMTRKKDRVVVFFDQAGNVDHLGWSLNARDSSFGFPFGQ